MFRNLTLFRVPVESMPSADQLDVALQGARLRSPGPLEFFTRGFVSPFGRQHSDLILAQGPHTLLSFGTDTRMLPAQVVNDEVKAKLDALESECGRRPGGRERKRIRDEVITQLLPRAFVRFARTDVWIDQGTGWVSIDSPSKKVCEAVIAGLREALGTFPATPVSAQSSATLTLTGWLQDALPEDFTIGDECVLHDPADDGAQVRCRRQDLEAEEVREHLNAGKVVERLAITYDGRVHLVIGEDMRLLKLRFSDMVMEQFAGWRANDADEVAALSADFALATGELRRLHARLDDLFELS